MLPQEIHVTKQNHYCSIQLHTVWILYCWKLIFYNHLINTSVSEANKIHLKIPTKFDKYFCFRKLHLKKIDYREIYKWYS